MTNLPDANSGGAAAAASGALQGTERVSADAIAYRQLCGLAPRKGMGFVPDHRHTLHSVSELNSEI